MGSIILMLLIAFSGIRKIGYWGLGPALSVNVEDNIVASGVGSGLYMIEDLGDTARLLESISLPSNVVDVKFWNGIIFAAEERDGIEAFKFSDSKLKSLFRIKTSGTPYRIYFCGDTLLVAQRSGGVDFYRIKENGLKKLTNILDDMEIAAVLKLDTLLIAAAADSGIFIVNLTSHNEVLKRIRTPDSAEDIDLLDDSTIAVTLWNGAIKVYRLSPASMMTEITQVSPDSIGFFLIEGRKIDDTLFVALGFQNDFTVGVMELIRWKGNYEVAFKHVHKIPGLTQGGVWENGALYLACDYKGIKKIRLEGERIRQLWRVKTPGYVIASVPLEDSYMVVVGKMGNISLVKFTQLDDSLRVHKIAIYSTDREFHDAVRYSGTVFMGCGDGRILYSHLSQPSRLYDILLKRKEEKHNPFITYLDPSLENSNRKGIAYLSEEQDNVQQYAPEDSGGFSGIDIGRLYFSLNADSLQLKGVVRHLTIDSTSHELYSANEWAGAYIMGISNTGEPSVKLHIMLNDTTGYVADVGRYGDNYVLLTVLGKVILWDKNEKQEKSFAQIGTWGYDMELVSSWVFVAADDSGLAVLRIEGDSIKLIERIPVDGGFARAIRVVGHHLYLSGISEDFTYGWLAVFDITHPDNPELIYKTELPGFGEKITYWPQKNWLVVSAFASGVIFYSIEKD